MEGACLSFLFLGSRIPVHLPKPETRDESWLMGLPCLPRSLQGAELCSLSLFHISHHLPRPSRSATWLSSGPCNSKTLLLVTLECSLVPTGLSPLAPREERLCGPEGCGCWVSILLNVSKLILGPRVRSVLMSVPGAPEKNEYSALFGSSALCSCQ